MRRRALVVLFAVVLAWGLVGPARPVRAQEGPSTTTSSIVPEPDIIPRPNQGTPPEDPGDRGGVLQGVIFFLIIGGTVVIGALVVRESRKARAGRGF